MNELTIPYYEFPIFSNEIDGKILACNERIRVDTLKPIEWTVTFNGFEFMVQPTLELAAMFYEGFLSAKRMKG